MIIHKGAVNEVLCFRGREALLDRAIHEKGHFRGRSGCLICEDRADVRCFNGAVPRNARKRISLDAVEWKEELLDLAIFGGTPIMR